jgi:hypothetical protein
MDERSFVCDTCGGTRRLFFERKPFLMALAFAAGVTVLAATVLIPELAEWRGRLIYLGVIVPALAYAMSIRIRCLSCEPRWRGRAWGKLSE